MRLATRAQSETIDQLAQTKFQIPAEILMESAGLASAHEIMQSYFPEMNRGRTAIVCGPGNNGADGLVVARHLLSAGYQNLSVVTVGLAKSELFATQLARLRKQEIEISTDLRSLDSTSLIVDALFGVGMNRNISGEFADVIRWINKSKVPVVSLDVPSGLDCDTGQLRPLAVKASMTLTFGLARPGFFISDGPAHVGRLRILPIGYPRELTREIANSCFAFDEKMARKFLPNRPNSGNKSKFGHALIFAGSKSFWGSAILSATSAFRVGAGYVTLASFDDAAKVVNQTPETMIAELPKNPQKLDEKFLRDYLDAKKITAVGIGPGLGVNDKTANLIRILKKIDFQNVVVDADAITTCVQQKLFPLPKSWIMTPHAGELSRVIGDRAEAIESDRISAALKAVKVTGCHVLLKGYRSVLSDGTRSMIILAGNSALAKAGTGDVLTGMITGLIAQSLSVNAATATAAYLHGRIADDWIKEGKDKSTMLASDVRDLLPELTKKLKASM